MVSGKGGATACEEQADQSGRVDPTQNARPNFDCFQSTMASDVA